MSSNPMSKILVRNPPKLNLGKHKTWPVKDIFGNEYLSLSDVYGDFSGFATVGRTSKQAENAKAILRGLVMAMVPKGNEPWPVGIYNFNEVLDFEVSANPQFGKYVGKIPPDELVNVATGHYGAQAEAEAFNTAVLTEFAGKSFVGWVDQIPVKIAPVVDTQGNVLWDGRLYMFASPVFRVGVFTTAPMLNEKYYFLSDPGNGIAAHFDMVFKTVVDYISGKGFDLNADPFLWLAGLKDRIGTDIQNSLNETYNKKSDNSFLSQVPLWVWFVVGIIVLIALTR